MKTERTYKELEIILNAAMKDNHNLMLDKEVLHDLVTRQKQEIGELKEKNKSLERLLNYANGITEEKIKDAVIFLSEDYAHSFTN